jgi:hypothetical protein
MMSHCGRYDQQTCCERYLLSLACGCLLRLMLRSRAQVAAENLFLRKRFACYIERQVRPRRADNSARIALVLSQFVDWRQLLTIVQPDTLVRWHRNLDRLFWRLKSRQCGRPRIPTELQRRIAEMAAANHTWGEERIAAELRVKLGLTVSRVVARPRLGGLHHHYQLELVAA